MKTRSLKRYALLSLAAAIILACLTGAQVKAQTVWVVCTWDTSTIYHQRDGKEKFERRFYVTELIQTTTQVFVALTNHVPGLEQRGTRISYYTDGFDIFPASSPSKTFAEAWAARTERVETIKGNGYPQYDFLVITGGPNKGEATSFPFCAATCTGERSRVTALEMMKK